MTDDFSVPQFYENKLRLLENKKPHTFLLTGMSDFADWKSEWTGKVFEKIKANPQNHFIFLTKRPEHIKFSCDLDNVWIGVTVTCKAELNRITPKRQELIYNVFFLGKTFRAIAKEKGLSKSAISQQMKTVYKHLRKYLGV